MNNFRVSVTGKSNPFLSVVTRCYQRPLGLQRNIQSLLAQTDQDFEHIKIEDLQGVGFANANSIIVSHKHLPQGQYVLMLDDDDYLIHNSLIAELKTIAAKESPDVIIIKMQSPWGLLPDTGSWLSKKPLVNCIGGSNCIVKHDVWLNYIHHFNQGNGYGDFHFIDALYQSGVVFNWYDVTAVKVPQKGWGKSGD